MCADAKPLSKLIRSALVMGACETSRRSEALAINEPGDEYRISFAMSFCCSRHHGRHFKEELVGRFGLCVFKRDDRSCPVCLIELFLATERGRVCLRRPFVDRLCAVGEKERKLVAKETSMSCGGAARAIPFAEHNFDL